MAIPVRLERFQLNEIKSTIRESADQTQVVEAINSLAEVVRQGFQTQNEHLAGIQEALTHINQPDSDSAVKGEIVARYRVPADLPDFEYEIVGRNFTDSEGNPTHARDVDLSLDVANEAAITATLGEQTVSEDGNEVRVPVRAHVESPSADMGVLMYKATNRNTGEVIAADSDEFIVSAGAARLGTLESDIPGLTPEPEETTGGETGTGGEGTAGEGTQP